MSLHFASSFFQSSVVFGFMFKKFLLDNNFTMFTIFVRVLIIYITVLIFLRLMGKRQIGEMQPYEVVITLIIADLATIPMSDTNVPLLHGLLPLAILVLIHYAITFLTRKSVAIRRLMSGKPVVVISPEGIMYQALKELNMNIDDLLEAMRQGNYYSFDQVLYAIVETNGKISIIPTSASAPATAQDVNVENPPAQIPHVLVADGKLIKDEIKSSKISQKQLSKILEKLQLTIKNLLVFTLDDDGKVFYQTKGKQAQTISDINKEVHQWNNGFIC